MTVGSNIKKYAVILLTLLLAGVGSQLWKTKAHIPETHAPYEFSFKDITLGDTRNKIVDVVGDLRLSKWISKEVVLEESTTEQATFGFEREASIFMESPRLNVDNQDGTFVLSSSMSEDDVMRILGQPSYRKEILNGKIEVYEIPDRDVELSIKFLFIKGKFSLFGVPLHGEYHATGFRVTSLSRRDLLDSIPF